MPRANNTCRYIDFKCNLADETVYFPNVNITIKIGEKLGCGAYGDVFRGYVVPEEDESQENILTEEKGLPSQNVFQDEDARTHPFLNIQQIETVAINSNLDSNDRIDTTYEHLFSDVLPENKIPNKQIDYAIKYFKDDSIQMVDEGFTSGTIRELSIMKSCPYHPNIIKLVDVFVGEHEKISSRLNKQLGELLKNNKDCKINGKDPNLYQFKETQIFVLGLYEFCRGGDLGRLICKRMAKGGIGFSTAEIKWFAFQLLNGLAYLHNSKIEHRDLKPNNIMLDRDDEFPVLKIGDWGLGREYRSLYGTITPTACTMFYRPIEVILGSITISASDLVDKNTYSHNYGINVDMWSAACIIAEMITGQPLFHGNSDFQVLTRIVTILGRPTEEEWKNCSLSEHYPFNGSLYQFSTESRRENLKVALKGRIDDLGLDLMMNMLEYNPHSRISAQVALSHPWFADVDFRRLDSLGVTNSLTNSMRGMLSSKIVDVMEERSRGIVTTTLLSHLLHKKVPMRNHVIDAIERDYTTVTCNVKSYGLPVLIRSNESNQ